MTDLIFDPPWYLLVGLAMAGLVLLYSGLSKPAAGLRWAGLSVLAAAAGVFLLGWLVETGGERVARETREIAAAADKRDWKTFAALLDPKVKFAFYNGRDQLTSGAAVTMDKVGVHNVTLTNLQTREEPGGYSVSFTATADIEVTAHRAPTDWKFFWAKDPAGAKYLLYRIEPLPSQQFGTEPVIDRLARP